MHVVFFTSFSVVEELEGIACGSMPSAPRSAHVQLGRRGRQRCLRPRPTLPRLVRKIESPPTALGANIGVDLPTLICGVQPLAVVHYIVHYSELARVATSAKRLLPSNSVKIIVR